MGWLDRAKKLAGQAGKLAEQAKDKAEEALAEVKARNESDGSTAAAGSGTVATAPPRDDPRLGTPYLPGMLGKPGWREQGLVDPAAVLPIADRGRAGIPHSTKSEIVEEPFGMGRRWTSGERSAGLFYRLTDEQRAWLPPGGLVAASRMGGALSATLDGDRTVVFIDGDGVQVVLELRGLDDDASTALAASVAEQLASR